MLPHDSDTPPISGLDWLSMHMASDPGILHVTADDITGLFPDPVLMLSERLCRQYLDEQKEKKAEPPKPKFGPDTISSNLTPPQKKRAQDFLRRHDQRFLDKAGCFTHTVISLKLRPGAKPIWVPCPRWTPAVKEFLTQWADEMLATGRYSFASANCEWATRPCPVGKYDSPLQDHFRGIRMVFDYRAVNDRLLLPVPCLPNPDHHRELFAGHNYISALDMVDGFSHLKIDTTDDSRDILAVWTPRGLLVPNYMTQGIHRAPGDFQRAVDKSFGHLPFWGKTAAAYIDDVHVAHDDFDAHMDQLEKLMEAAEAAGCYFAADKLRIGYNSLPVLGKVCSKKGVAADTSKIDAILKISEPQNITEVRSILGMTNFIQAHIPNYSRLVAPLSDLLKSSNARPPGPNFFREREKKCFAKLKRVLTSLPILAKYDKTQRLYLRTDASIVGIGGALHSGPEKSAPVISYFSLKFTDTQSRWVTYVREAYGIIYGVQQSRYYIDASDHPLTIVTDHRPLIWLYHARSPMVVGWVLDHLQTIRFKVEYIQGKQNLLPDALSRIPCISPGQPTLLGEVEATKQLLDTIPATMLQSSGRTFWLAIEGTHPELDTRFKRHDCRILRGMPTIKTLQAPWDYAIVIPAAERAPEVARQLFALNKPFAVLIPQDMVHLIPDGEAISRETVLACHKIVFLEDNLVWLVHNFGLDRHAVLNMYATSHAPRVTRADIQSAQKEDPLLKPLWDGSTSIGQGNTLLFLKGGLAVHIMPDRSRRIYVPEPLIRKLVSHAHLTQNHAKAPTLAPYIHQRYIWFGHDGKDRMHADIAAILRDCHFCQLCHARLKLNHGRYNSLVWNHPGQAIGIDHVHVGIDGVLEQYVLTIVDLFAGYLLFVPVISTTAEETVETILARWVCLFGFPEAILSDDHGSFRGNLAKAFCSMAGIDWLTTAPYSHHQLGMVERRHQSLRRAIQALSDKDKKTWPKAMPALSFSQNTYVSTATGVSAFEGMMARQPRTSIDIFDAPEVIADRAARSTAAMTKSGATTLQTSDQLDTLRLARIAVTAYVKEYVSFTRKAANEQKNKQRRRKLPDWKIGDRVTVYRPKQSTKGVPASSVLQHDGPYVIMGKPTNNTFRLRHEHTNKVLRKIDIAHLSPYTAPADMAQAIDPARDEEHNDDSKNYALGEVIAFIDDGLLKLGIIMDEDPTDDRDDFRVHQLGITSTTNMQYRPVYVELINHPDGTLTEGPTHLQWTRPLNSWKKMTLDSENDQVVHRNIQFKPASNNKSKGYILPDQLKRLRQPYNGTQYDFHVFKGLQSK